MGRRGKRINKLRQSVSMSQGKAMQAGTRRLSHLKKKNSNISLSPAEFVFVRLNQVTHARFVFSHLNARPGRSGGHIA
jgi:hypothetical protein